MKAVYRIDALDAGERDAIESETDRKNKPVTFFPRRHGRTEVVEPTHLPCLFLSSFQVQLDTVTVYSIKTRGSTSKLKYARAITFKKLVALWLRDAHITIIIRFLSKRFRSFSAP